MALLIEYTDAVTVNADIGPGVAYNFSPLVTRQHQASPHSLKFPIPTMVLGA